jgi:hypothetical protein
MRAGSLRGMTVAGSAGAGAIGRGAAEARREIGVSGWLWGFALSCSRRSPEAPDVNASSTTGKLGGAVIISDAGSCLTR